MEVYQWMQIMSTRNPPCKLRTAERKLKVGAHARVFYCVFLPWGQTFKRKRGKKTQTTENQNTNLFSMWRKICTSILLVAELKVRNALASPQPFLRPENCTVPSNCSWNNALKFLPLTGRHTEGREPFKHTQSKAVQATSNRWKAA